MVSNRSNRVANGSRIFDQKPLQIQTSAPAAPDTFVVFYARTRMENNDMTWLTQRNHSKPQCFLRFLRFHQLCNFDRFRERNPPKNSLVSIGYQSRLRTGPLSRGGTECCCCFCGAVMPSVGLLVCDRWRRFNRVKNSVESSFAAS